jgi:hypothetical protein
MYIHGACTRRGILLSLEEQVCVRVCVCACMRKRERERERERETILLLSGSQSARGVCVCVCVCVPVYLYVHAEHVPCFGPISKFASAFPFISACVCVNSDIYWYIYTYIYMQDTCHPSALFWGSRMFSPCAGLSPWVWTWAVPRAEGQAAVSGFFASGSEYLTCACVRVCMCALVSQTVLIAFWNGYTLCFKHLTVSLPQVQIFGEKVRQSADPKLLNGFQVALPSLCLSHVKTVRTISTEARAHALFVCLPACLPVLCYLLIKYQASSKTICLSVLRYIFNRNEHRDCTKHLSVCMPRCMPVSQHRAHDKFEAPNVVIAQMFNVPYVPMWQYMTMYKQQAH